MSDVIARMGYKSDSHRDILLADYHIGKSADEDVDNRDAHRHGRLISIRIHRFLYTPIPTMKMSMFLKLSTL